MDGLQGGEEDELYEQISTLTRQYEQQLKKIREQSVQGSHSASSTPPSTKRVGRQLQQKHDELGNRLTNLARQDPAKNLRSRAAKLPASAPSSRRSSFSKSSGGTVSKAQNKLPKDAARKVRALERKHGQNIKTAKQAVTKDQEVSFDQAERGVHSARKSFQKGVIDGVSTTGKTVTEDIASLVQQTRKKISHIVNEEMERKLESIEEENIAKSGYCFARIATEIVEKAQNLIQELEDQLEEENDKHFQHLEEKMKGELERFIHNSAEAIEQGYQTERKELCDRTKEQMEEQIEELTNNMDTQEREYRQYLQEIQDKETSEKLEEVRNSYGNQLRTERETYERQLKQQHEQKLEDMEEALVNEHRNAIADLERRLQDEHQRNMQRKADNALKQYEKEVSEKEKKLRKEMEIEDRQLLREIRAEHEGNRHQKIQQLQQKLQEEMTRRLEEERQKLAEEEREIFAKVRKEADAATQQEIEKLRDSNSGHIAATVASLTASMEEERANRIAEIMRQHNQEKQEAMERTQTEIEEEFNRREQKLRESFENEREEAMAKARSEAFEKMQKRLENKHNEIHRQIQEEIGTKQSEWTHLRRQAERELEEIMENIKERNREQAQSYHDHRKSSSHGRHARRGLRHEPFSPSSDVESPSSTPRRATGDESSMDDDLVRKFEDTLKKLNTRYESLLEEHSSTESKLARIAKEVVQLRKTVKMLEQRERELQDRLGIARSLTSESAGESSFAMHERSENVKQKFPHLHLSSDSWYDTCQKLYQANQELIGRLHSQSDVSKTSESRNAGRRHSIQVDQEKRNQSWNDKSFEGHNTKNYSSSTGQRMYHKPQEYKGPREHTSRPKTTDDLNNSRSTTSKSRHYDYNNETQGTVGYAKRAIEQALSRTSISPDLQNKRHSHGQSSDLCELGDTESQRTYSTVSEISPERDHHWNTGKGGENIRQMVTSPATQRNNASIHSGTNADTSPGGPPSLNTTASTVDSYVQRAKERLADYIGSSAWESGQDNSVRKDRTVSFGLAKRNLSQQLNRKENTVKDWIPLRGSQATSPKPQRSHSVGGEHGRNRNASSTRGPSKSLRKTTVSTEMKRTPKKGQKRSASAKGKLKQTETPNFSVAKKKNVNYKYWGPNTSRSSA